ncbi:MAG: hypothetical protein LBJ10_01585 [Clostridiales bacterium]|nr:hypothetical protein [Clostridiales bacterium]
MTKKHPSAAVFEYPHAAEKAAPENVDGKTGEGWAFSVSAANEASELIRKLPATFGGALIALMGWREMTVEQLAEKSLVSPKTIQRMRTNIHHKFELRTVIAVCIGLNLPCYVSTALVERAGLAFKPTDEHVAYQHLLTEYCNRTTHDCNEALQGKGGQRPEAGRQ